MKKLKNSIHTKCFFNLLILRALTLSIFSCKKDSDADTKEESEKQADVYVSGIAVKETGVFPAAYWKNGVANKLSDGTRQASANSVSVSGNNVYVAGRESNGSKLVGKLWKNNTPIILTDGSDDTYINGLSVWNNNTYVTGYSGAKLQVWKNGIAQAALAGQGYAHAIFVKEK